MNISENEAHSAIYCSENEYFARRCRHYKAKESKAEWLDYTKATVVDYIVPHRGDQKLFWDKSNWQPLCKACHDRKTWREDNRPTYTY